MVLLLASSLPALQAVALGTARATSGTLFSGSVSRADLSPAVSCRRSDANYLEGVHSEPTHELTQLVLSKVPELGSWDEWYAHPRLVANGHLHTILAAKLRKTRAVKYHRVLVPTPDGGTLAVDLLAGIRRVEQSGSPGSRTTAPSSLLTGGALPGAAEEDGFTMFVPEAPPLDPERPMLLLASGLGGGSQDTYVRSLAATAAERGWQVAVINMRACGSSPVTSPRLFSAYRGANDDLRLAVKHLRATCAQTRPSNRRFASHPCHALTLDRQRPICCSITPADPTPPLQAPRRERGDRRGWLVQQRHHPEQRAG